MNDLLSFILEVIGTVACAISGIRLAAHKKFDWFGAYVVGLVTAIGGGTLRDLLLGIPVFWMHNWWYLAVTGISLLTVLVFRKLLVSHNRMLFTFDSIGLAMFCVIGIDKTLYEAAVIDGAGVWEQIVSVTLPCMKKTIIILMIMAVGRICYSDFGLFYQVPMHSGMLYSTTQTIDTFVYRALLEQNSIGRSAAAGFFQSVLGFVLVMTANGIVRRVDEESALI